MQDFHYRNNELHCGDLAVTTVAQSVQTPFYLYSKRAIADNFRAFDSALAGLDHLICYALKANSNDAILTLLSSLGAGADVVSGGEIYLALKNGFGPGKIVFAGVGKTDEEIKYALEQDILSFNVESKQELEVLNEISGRLNKRARVELRINPNIDIHGHPYISTGKSENKFGVDLDSIPALMASLKAMQHVDLVGLHCHTGSQIMNSAPYLATIKVLSALRETFKADGIELTSIDIGGGIGVQYENVLTADPPGRSDPFDADAPDRILNPLVPELAKLNCKVIFEPGRALVANTGILVSRVLFTKETRGKHFIVVDSGMTELIRPSLYNAYHDIVPLKQHNGEVIRADVVGPICESGDFLAKERALPRLERGDLIAVMTTGAYGFSLSSNYNARPRPAEVLVDGKEFDIVRERGKVRNLWT